MRPLFTPANDYVEVEEAMVLFPRGTGALGSFWTTWGRGCHISLIPTDEVMDHRKRGHLRTDIQEGQCAWNQEEISKLGRNLGVSERMFSFQ